MKKMKRFLLSVCILAMLIGCMGMSAFADNDDYVTYKMTAGDTVIAVCNKYGINFGQNQTWITNVNHITNYNDIKVTVKLTGSCKTYENKKSGGVYAFTGSQSFEKDDIEIECDITGKGSFYKEEKLSGGAYTHSEMVESNFEIVSISGTVTPA